MQTRPATILCHISTPGVRSNELQGQCAALHCAISSCIEFTRLLRWALCMHRSCGAFAEQAVGAPSSIALYHMRNVRLCVIRWAARSNHMLYPTRLAMRWARTSAKIKLTTNRRTMYASNYHLFIGLRRHWYSAARKTSLRGHLHSAMRALSLRGAGKFKFLERHSAARET